MNTIEHYFGEKKSHHPEQNDSSPSAITDSDGMIKNLSLSIRLVIVIFIQLSPNQ